MATQRISAYQYWIEFGGAGSVWAVLVGTWWYWVCITWHCSVLSATGLEQSFYAWIYWRKKMGIGSNVTKAGRTTNKQTRKDRVTQLMQWTMDGWDELSKNIALGKADPRVEFSFKLGNTKVTLGHITNSRTNLNQISPSESPPSINWKISTKQHHLD